MAELQWAAKRRSSQWPKSNEITMGTVKEAGCFRAALSQYELTVLESYEELYPRQCVYKLSQNARKKRGVASGPEIWHCVIRNTQIKWSDIHQRWWTASELLLAQGFLVREHLVGPFRDACHDQRTSFVNDCLGRKFQIVKGQAGDSMNIGSVGAMWLYIGVFVMNP